jgi:hypothetical protein
VAGPGADLAVTALSVGFRIELVLRERPSNPIEFKLPVQTSGLTSEEGGRLVNSKGFTTAVIQQPSMRDNAKRRTVTAPKAGRVDASMQSDNGRQLLTIKPDSAFLNDPATTYPVAAGPSFLLPVANDVDVADDGQPANPANPLLTAGNIFGTLNRVHLRFDTSAVTGLRIADAKLSLLNTDAPGCGSVVGAGIQARRATSSWDQNTLTWANKPSTTTEGAQTVTKAYASECGSGVLEWPITTIAQAWAYGAPNYGVVLQAPNESNPDDNYRVFAASEATELASPPKLTMTYQGIAGPTVLYPAGPDGVEVFQAPASWRFDTLDLDDVHTYALSGAKQRSEDNADVLAPPYVEPVTGDLVAPATAAGKGQAGQPLTGTAVPNGAADWTIPGYVEEGEGAPVAPKHAIAAEETPYSMTPKVIEVANSTTTLNAIADQVLLPESQIPSGDQLFRVSPWPQRNLVMVEATAVTPEMRKALADKFGVNSVAIWLKPNANVPVVTWRLADGGRADGGAQFSDDPKVNGDCTTGFSWGNRSGENFMLTAGHCIASLGSTLNTTIGERVWTTWQKGVGSVRLDGQTGLHGDLGLIKVKASKNPTNPRIYADAEGAPLNTSKTRQVGGRWGSLPKVGDQYCVGGITSGDTCGWKVVDVSRRQTSYNPGGKSKAGTVHRVVVGQKTFGTCSAPGDSGGPVYTVWRSGPLAGYVNAKGITHGGSERKPDANGKIPPGSEDNPCEHTFSEIHDAITASNGLDINKVD